MNSSNNSALQILKSVIEKEAFVTNKEYRIIEGSGKGEADWLMDFRRVLLKPSILNTVAEVFFEMEQGRAFQIGGIEVAAIPMIAAVVMKSIEKGQSANGFFIRKSRKKTGLLNMVEGIITDERIVLVDDILNTGKSFMRQIEVIESLGKKVDTVIVILRFRDESYYEELHKRGIKVRSLFCLDDFKGVLPVQNFKIKNDTPIPYPYKVLWRFKSEGAHLEQVLPKSAPLLVDGVLYFGSDSGIFWAIDAHTGAVRWSYKVPFGVAGKLIFSTPAYYKDAVFFGAYNGNFYALDKNTGEVKWIAWHADWIGSSPVVAHDLGLVYIGMEFGFWKVRGGVAAYDVHTGKRVWQSESNNCTHGSPAYSIKNKIVVCGSNDGIVYGLHARSGKVLWAYNASGEVKATCSLSSSEKYVAFGSFNKEFVVLETKTGKKVHAFETMEANYTTPAWEGDEAIVCSSLDKRIYKFSVKHKNTAWTYIATTRVFASPLIDDGKVYCGDNAARMNVLDLATGKEVALHQATERITNQVAIDKKTGALYVPTFANEIIALKLID